MNIDNVNNFGKTNTIVTTNYTDRLYFTPEIIGIRTLYNIKTILCEIDFE